MEREQRLYVVCGPPSSGKTAYCEREVRESSGACFRTSYRHSLFRGKADTVKHLKTGAAAVYVDEQHAMLQTRRDLVKHVLKHVPPVKIHCLHFLPDGGAEQVRWAYECALASAMAVGADEVGVAGGPPAPLTGTDVEVWFGHRSVTRAPQQDEGEGWSYASPPEQIRHSLDPSLLDALGTPALPARAGLFLDARLLADASSQQRTAALHSSVAAWLDARPDARVAVMLVQQTLDDRLPDAVFELASFLAPKRELYFAAQATVDDVGRPIDGRPNLGVFLARRYGVPPERALCVGRGTPAQQQWASGLPSLPFVSGDQFLSASEPSMLLPAGYELPTFVPGPSMRTGTRLSDPIGTERAGQGHGRLHGRVTLADRPVVALSLVAQPDPLLLLTEADLARCCTHLQDERTLLNKAMRELLPQSLTARSRQGKALHGMYAGTGAEAYTTHVCVGERELGELVASSACSCPQGLRAAAGLKAVCKHVFFVLLAYARDPQSFDAATLTPGASPVAAGPPQAAPHAAPQSGAAAACPPTQNPPSLAVGAQKRSLPSRFHAQASGARPHASAQPALKAEGSSTVSARATAAAARRQDALAERVVVDLTSSDHIPIPTPADSRRSTVMKAQRAETVPEFVSLEAPYPRRLSPEFLLAFAKAATEATLRRQAEDMQRRQASRPRLAGATTNPVSAPNSETAAVAPSDSTRRPDQVVMPAEEAQ